LLDFVVLTGPRRPIGPTVKSLSIEARLLAAFGGALAVLALCAWFALDSVSDYVGATHRAQQLGDAAHAVADLRAAVVDAAATNPAASGGTRSQLANARDAARATLPRVPPLLILDSEVAFLEQRSASAFRRLDAFMQASATSRPLPGAPLDEATRALVTDLRVLDEWLVGRERAAREAAGRHGERGRNLIALLAVLVIMALCGAYAFVSGGLRERRRLLARLRQSVNHDPLTGLPNRRFFGEWLGYAIAHARREVRHVGLLFVEIEGVKAVQELHGEADADALLIEIARRFRETAREGDLLARIGPNEFALAIPDVTDPREAAPLAQRLRDALADPARPPLADTPIGASVGVAFYPDDAQDPAGVIAAADAAMVTAKGAGRNRVAFPPLAQAA
jgi:diguanylate cyclase (GGDEF)-like protein